jgi:hypothetical protein
MMLKADGTVEGVTCRSGSMRMRLIEEFMILANVAAAETLEKARVPLIYRVHDEPSLEKVEALREFLESLASTCRNRRAAARAVFNRILGPGERARRRENLTSTRSCCAHRRRRNMRRELRPLWPQPEALRAFHLADPPLCRSDRASRADPRARARRRRAARLRDASKRCRGRGGNFAHRTPRDEGRARNRRPADRAFPCRPRRRDVQGGFPA